MKKRLVTLISIIVALVLSLGIFSGCNLVTTNTERDMNQVVAEVKIDGYKGEVDSIYKRDMMIAYMNYGYYYVQMGQATPQQMFENIITSLVNNRILLQKAKITIKEKNGTLEDNLWKASEIITDEEDVVNAKYNAIYSIDSLIEQSISTESKSQDTIDVPKRAVPKNAANKVYELSKEEKQKYINERITTDGKPTELFKGKDGSKRLVAYNKTIKLLEVNEVLGSEYQTGNIYTSYYYNYLVEGNFETILIKKFRSELLLNETFNTLKFEILEGVFKDLYDSQKKLYENDETAYKTAISSATKNAPIVYSKAEYQTSYGYVWNLLIGASEEQKETIKDIKKDNNKILWYEDTDERLTDLDNNIVMKDQRSSWVTAGYDCVFIPTEDTTDADNLGTVRFINDYTFLGDNGIPFQGEVKWLNKGDYTQIETFDTKGNKVMKYSKENDAEGNPIFDENYVPEFSVVSVTEFRGIGVINNKLDELLGATITNDIINELLFAFSTDDGSLSSTMGYIVKIDDDASSFVPEFQNKAEEILSGSTSGYCVTDYGYHFMFKNDMVKDYQSLNEYCQAVDSKVMDKACKKAGATAKEYFNYLIKNWQDLTAGDKDTYLYTIAKTYMDTLISDFESELTRTTTSGVTKYESRYADLIG